MLMMIKEGDAANGNLNKTAPKTSHVEWARPTSGYKQGEREAA